MNLSTDTCRKWSTVIGVFLLLFPMGMLYAWGNLAVYTNSYFYNRLQIRSGLYAPKALVFLNMSSDIAIVISGFLCKVVQKRLILVFSVLLTAISLLSSHFAIQNSIIAFNVLFGVTYGFSVGPILVIGLKYVVDHVEERTGFYIVLCREGIFVGAILTNQFVSLYINADNLEPKQDVGPSKLFDQADVIDRVPYIFLYMAGGFGLIQIAGLLLLRHGDKNNCARATTMLSLQEYKHHGSYGTNEDRNKSCVTVSSAVCNEEISEEENDGATSSRPLSLKDKAVPKLDDKSVSGACPVMSEIPSNAPNHAVNEFTPKQMLRTPEFYSLFFTYLTFVFNCIVTNFYYKTYGLLWIQNDLLLSSIGNVAIALSIFTSIVWGILVDKYNVKVCLIALNSISSIAFFFYYFMPMVSTSLYYVFCVSFASILTPGDVIYNSAIVKYFGKTNFTANCGLLYSGLIVMNLGTAFILEYVLLHCGWFYLFCLCGVLSSSALIYVVFAL